MEPQEIAEQLKNGGAVVTGETISVQELQEILEYLDGVSSNELMVDRTRTGGTQLLKLYIK